MTAAATSEARVDPAAHDRPHRVQVVTPGTRGVRAFAATRWAQATRARGGDRARGLIRASVELKQGLLKLASTVGAVDDDQALVDDLMDILLYSGALRLINARTARLSEALSRERPRRGEVSGAR